MIPYHSNDRRWKYAVPAPGAKPFKVKCRHCGKPPTPEGHDPCLGTLPGGVLHACCGHGQEPGHVRFTNGVVIRGQFDEETLQNKDPDYARKHYGVELPV